ncbi:polyprenyl diphosphate synthase [Alphaproteobacteria bacterium]|nr:polyprenyl diphosphate synthase [Alphaproteobacteria bacterium]
MDNTASSLPLQKIPANNASSQGDALHFGIVMDGNGRWAKSRGMPRLAGHRAGIDALKRVVRGCPDVGVTYLTVYAFSTENWRRPQEEVMGLLSLIRRFIQSEIDELCREGVRLSILGDKTIFPKDLQELLENAEKKTASNTQFYLNVALNYGARQDITRACQKAVAEITAQGGDIATELTEALIGQQLSTADFPPLDVIMRTSGEQRLSNFLLWEASYAELVFVQKHWPDFDVPDLEEVIASFQGRARRFGAL